MAEAALLHYDFPTAESYCVKVLEQDPKSSKGWILKAWVIGRSITTDKRLTKDRFAEVVECYVHAVSFTPQTQRGELLVRLKKELSKLSKEIIEIKLGLFSGFPYHSSNDSPADDVEGVFTLIQEHLSCVDYFTRQMSQLVPISERYEVIEFSGLRTEFHRMITIHADKASSTVSNDCMKAQARDSNEWYYKKRGADQIIRFLTSANTFFGKSAERYKLIIAWHESLTGSDSRKALGRKEVMQHIRQIEECKRELRDL